MTRSSWVGFLLKAIGGLALNFDASRTVYRQARGAVDA
jgi:hypothetical protein